MYKICHIQVLPIMSGPQQSMLEIFRCLDRNVFEPSVVCQSAGLLTEELERRRIPYYLVPELGREIRPWRDGRAYRALKQLFQSEYIDVVHNQTAKPRVLGALAARHAGVPVVINHVRCYSFHNGTPRWRASIYRRIEAYAARFSDENIFVNNEERLTALAYGVTTPERSRTIYNGVDLTRFSPVRREQLRGPFRSEHGLSEDEFAILFLGRLEEPKQPLIFPEIAAELDKRLDRPWKMLICGDGSYSARLEAAVARANLAHRFLFLGWHSSPDEALCAADVVMLPSIWEGCPRVLLEAHAIGLPCVGSDICGVREVITQGETGMLVPARDADAFAGALALLATDDMLRERMGGAARQRAKLHFDGQQNNREIIGRYYELLGLSPTADVRRAA